MSPRKSHVRLFGFLATLTTMAQAAASGQTYQVLKSFDPEITHPESALILDPAGNLYGTTSAGYGSVFRLDTSNVLTALHSFRQLDGAAPVSGLLRDPAGNLFGMTRNAGAHGLGSIFEIDTSSTAITLHSFAGPDGAVPYGDLIRDAAGNLYGTTSRGGDSDKGTIFVLDVSRTLTTLHSFTGPDGDDPRSGLVKDPSGNLLGTTRRGGAHGAGSVYQLDPAGVLTTLHSFAISDGAVCPISALIRDPSGNLYGTSFGIPPPTGVPSTIFRLSAGGVLTILAQFTATGIVRDSAGNLFGATTYGGAYSKGSIFELDPAGTLTVLYSFNGPDGANPAGNLISDASGNLFGTTKAGGAYGLGTVFELGPSGLVTLYSFSSPAAGIGPHAGLVRDDAGKLYGTTAAGGVSGNGTIFEFDAANALTTLHAFDGTDGTFPTALTRTASGLIYGLASGVYPTPARIFRLDDSGTPVPVHTFDSGDLVVPAPVPLTVDDSGNLYGGMGGYGWDGYIFKIDGSDSFSTVFSFFGLNGSDPYSRLLWDDAGALLGTTYYGGASGQGTVFRVSVDGVLTTLHNFDVGHENAGPGLARDSAGNLFGSTWSDIQGACGTLFKLDPTGMFTTLHQFAGSDGCDALTTMVDDAGIVRGTTLGGGSHGAGTIFQLDASAVLTTLHDFSGIGGSGPNFPLIEDESGIFYGTTKVGGANATGVIFSYSSDTEPVTLARVEPTSGTAAGGILVAARGTGFQDGATLEIGGAPAAGPLDFDAHEVWGLAPSLIPGTLNDVAVSNPGLASGPDSTLSGAYFADFLDVPHVDAFHDYVEKVFRATVTAGCGGGYFCRDSAASRKQMAVFVLKAKEGASYSPPPATGIFTDVPASDLFAPWIEELHRRGVVAGCGDGTTYCPNDPVLRQQMAVFLLKTLLGSSYTPPACAGAFPDVPCSSPFASWIEDLYSRSIAAGCGDGDYCPSEPTTRGQMAVFLTKTFGF